MHSSAIGRNTAGEGESSFRGRTFSAKRQRTEGNDSNQKNTRRPTIKGTSDPQTNGRKLQSPPVDIFVRGLPKDTEEVDIVADLAISGIFISTNEIQRKSKDVARLNSYKISVKAADKEKVMDPMIWPMGG